MESILHLSTIAFKRKRTVEKAREETTTIGSIHISKRREENVRDAKEGKNGRRGEARRGNGHT